MMEPGIRESVIRGSALSGLAIKENSFIARCAAGFLKADRLAIVIGKTIYLHNTAKADFLKNTAWVKHEMAHIRQFARYGFIPFIVRYLWESLRAGYRNNKYEIEAREAERLPL
jgi:hypothetical protein